MSRAISPTVLSSMMAQESAEAFVILLTFSHPILASPIRVCSHKQDFLSNGLTFLACPFQIDLPSESASELPRVQLTNDNVDRRIVEGVRSIPHGAGALTVTMELVTEGLPDTVEAGPFDFLMKRATYNRLVVVGEIAFEDILNLSHPSGKFTPNDHPGMF